MSNSRQILLSPFRETAKMMGEAISLEQSMSAGYLKLSEPSMRHTKDRIVALAMGNFFIDFLEKEYLKDQNVENMQDIIMRLNDYSEAGNDLVSKFFK